MREPLANSGRIDAPSGLFVLGMHRSGTSALANLCADLGYRLPSDPIPPLPDNTEGFGESRGLALFNDAVMAALGGTWHAPPPVKQQWATLAREVRSEADAAFETAFGRGDGGSPWLWKDPRLCVALPFWRALLGNEPVRTLLVFRHPRSVATSLAAPNRAHERFKSVEFGLALWERYNLALLDNLRPGDEVLAVDFDRLLVDTDYRAAWSAQLSSFVGPEIGHGPDTVLEAVDARVKPRMVNARDDGDDLPDEIDALLGLLRERSDGFVVTDFSHPPESAATAALLKAHGRCDHQRPCQHRGAPRPASTPASASAPAATPQ